MLNCNSCSKLIPDDSEFCPFCGNKIIKKAVTLSENSEQLHLYQPEALLKRAFLLLEEGLFDKADAYLEAVLNQDPENAEAYLGKLLLDLRISSVDELSNVYETFDHNINYKRALIYGDEKLKEKLIIVHKDCMFAITKREEERIEKIYSEAIDLMSTDDEENYKRSLSLFETISEYKDTTKFIDICLKRLNEIKNDTIYDQACTFMNYNDIDKQKKALELFQLISDWKDSTEKILLCNKQIEELMKEENKNENVLRVIACIIFCILLGCVIWSVTLFER